MKKKFLESLQAELEKPQGFDMIDICLYGNQWQAAKAEGMEFEDWFWKKLSEGN